MRIYQLQWVLLTYLGIPNIILSVVSAKLEKEHEKSPRIKYPYVSKIYESVPQWIKLNGFNVEIHHVTSSDGYISTLFRIPQGRWPNTTAENSNKKVAYFAHGNFADSSSWVLNSVDSALGYRLADLGVDVWLGNARGTRYSLGHVNMDYKELKYWNFSFHEQGDKDLPAIYDYILEKTGQSDLYFISHSMGATEFFTSMSLHPEYIPKIRTFIGLAPAVYFGNTTNVILKAVAPFMPFQQSFHDGQGLIGPIMPPALLPAMSIAGDICTAPDPFTRWVCMMVLDGFFGFDPMDGNFEMIPEIMSHILSSTSAKATFHLIQYINSGEFEFYDYYKNNMEIYGQERPPKYDTSNVTVPVVLFHGADDNIITPPDVYKLAAHLPNVKEVKLLNWPKFNHIDFVFSTEINVLVNDRIVEIIDKDLYYDKND